MEGAAGRENYRSGDNLTKRQALFHYVDPHRSHGTPAIERIVWSGNERVLDAGCGNGSWIRTLAERFNVTETIGLDVSTGMLVDARHAVGARRSWVAGDVQSLPFADESFDVVLSFWMLYHVPDHESTLHEFRRVLRSGGRLLVTTNSNRPRPLDAVFAAALSAATNRQQSWPPGFSFSAENGAERLLAEFGTVAAEPVDTVFVVPDPGPLLDVLESMRGPMQAFVGVPLDWGSVVDEARRRIESVIERHGSFETEMTSVSFLAVNED